MRSHISGQDQTNLGERAFELSTACVSLGFSLYQVAGKLYSLPWKTCQICLLD